MHVQPNRVPESMRVKRTCNLAAEQFIFVAHQYTQVDEPTAQDVSC